LAEDHARSGKRGDGIMAEYMRIRREIVFAFGITAAVAASRAIYAPNYLVNFDAVNFALAIREFNPGLHQPQPPGYPLFVLLLKSLDLVLRHARLDLLVSGLIGSTAAVLLLWGLGNAIYGEAEGYLGALVLAANPVFWYAGLANPVRTYLAVISIATAWAGWNCLHKQSPGIWFYAMGASLGLLSGFRPETVILLAPLFVGVGLRARVGAARFALAALLLAACAGSWISVLVYKAGGLQPFLELHFGYLKVNSQDYTLAFGASRMAALETVRRSFAWNFLPAIPWAWALLFAWSQVLSAVSRGRGWFIAIWFLPPFLFHALVHLRDIDQTLVTTPVVSLIGGWALANLKWPKRRLAVPAAAVAMLALSFYCFRRPPVADLRLASNGTVRYANDWMRATRSAVDTLQAEGPLAIVCYGSVVTWRQISYYYPDTPVLYLPGVEKGSETISPFWTLHRRIIAVADPITLPEIGNIAWSGAPGPGMREALVRVAPVREVGPLVVTTRASKGSRFRMGKWNLVAGSTQAGRLMKSARLPVRSQPRPCSVRNGNPVITEYHRAGGVTDDHVVVAVGGGRRHHHVELVQTGTNHPGVRQLRSRAQGTRLIRSDVLGNDRRRVQQATRLRHRPVRQRRGWQPEPGAEQ